jgi:hypothetical protein
MRWPQGEDGFNRTKTAVRVERAIAVILYQSSDWVTDCCPVALRDGHDLRLVPPHFPRENVMNPSLFGIRTFGSVWALIVSFSPMIPLSCNK